MKSLIVFLIILNLIAMLVNSTIKGAINCYDNSYHMTKKPDNKCLHRVHCTCPCWRFPQSFKRNRCMQCRHFHIDATPLSEANLEHIPDLRALERAIGSEKMCEARLALACQQSAVPHCVNDPSPCCYPDETAVTGVNQTWLTPGVMNPLRSYVIQYR